MPIVKIHNPYIDGVVDTKLNYDPKLPNLDIDLTKIINEINSGDAYQLQIAGDAALGGDIGISLSVSYIPHGTDKGIYVYGTNNLNVGLGGGVSISGGVIMFNPAYRKTIDRHSFEGWSFYGSASWFDASGTYVRAYSDGKAHMPGYPTNPPYLYDGVLGNYGLTPGEKYAAIATWGYSYLIASFSFK